MSAIMTLINKNILKSNMLLKTKSFSLFSKILNEQRDIQLYAQLTEYDSNNNPKPCTIIYLLDGDEHFLSFKSLLKEIVPTENVVVVGMPNTNRMRDLTPTHSLYGAEGKIVRSYKTSGGGENFIKFIETELMPHINTLYPLIKRRVLIGHSLGGLTVINTLLHHTHLFDAYVASEPSMWWHHKASLFDARITLKQKHFTDKSLFVGIANTMPKGMDIGHIKDDISDTTNHMRSILELVDVLNTNTVDGLKFNYQYYSTESHNSIPMVACRDALYYVLAK